jgi:hypothetical protein
LASHAKAGCSLGNVPFSSWQTTKITASPSISPDLLGGQSAAFVSVQHFMGDLMNESGKFFGISMLQPQTIEILHHDKE